MKFGDSNAFDVTFASLFALRRTHIERLVGSDQPHVVHDTGIGPVSSQDGPALRVEFCLPHDLEPSPLEAKVETSDARKETSHSRHQFPQQWRLAAQAENPPSASHVS